MDVGGTCAHARRVGGLAFLALLLFLALGCGDGSTPLQPSSAVQVKIGDAAADRVVALEMTLTSMVLTKSDGQLVSVLPEARRIEFARLAGTVEPVALLNIPQGSYTEAALAGSDLHLTYLDAAGAVQEYTQAREITTSMVVNPQLGVTTSSIISIDLNLAASILSIDPTNVAPPQFRPVYSFSISPVSATKQQDEEGALEHVIGVITAADSSSFTMQLGQNGILLTFAVDASTAFQDITLTTLPNMRGSRWRHRRGWNFVCGARSRAHQYRRRSGGRRAYPRLAGADRDREADRLQADSPAGRSGWCG